MKYDKEVLGLGALAISLFVLAIFFLVLQNTSLLFIFDKKTPISLDLTTVEIEEDSLSSLSSNALLIEKSTEKKRDLAEEIERKIKNIDRKLKKDYSLTYENPNFTTQKESQNETDEMEEDQLFQKPSPKYTGASAYMAAMENRWMVKEYLPIYQCKNGGKITITVEINPMGEILNFKIDPKNSVLDPCLQKSAIESVQKTLFNIDFNAPKSQRGKIIFQFSAQK